MDPFKSKQDVLLKGRELRFQIGVYFSKVSPMNPENTRCNLYESH